MVFEEDSEQQQQQSVFDLLPDALVLEIFNRVQDAKSLSACMCVCKHFSSLVPQTDAVSLTIARKKNLPAAKTKPTTMKGLISRAIFNPIRSLLQRVVAKKSSACACCDDGDDSDGDFSFRLPNDMLKNFKEIRSLVVELPSHDGDISSNSGGAFLKWNAEFGKELESCVILGATGFQKSETREEIVEKGSRKENENDHDRSNLTNKQLKKRVVWAISCLIAASARHHVLKSIISANRTIHDVEICDGSKQGKIRMTDRQVVELRKEMESTADLAGPEAETMERTKVPAVMVKMWYVPVLELPESGYTMKGATVAVIRPVKENRPASEKDDDDDDVRLATGGFGDGGERCFGEAVRKLIKKKAAYTLEMNSF